MKLASLWLPDPAELAPAPPLASGRAGLAGGGCLLGAVAIGALAAGLLLGPRLHLGDGAFLRDAVLVQALPLVGLVLVAAMPAIAAMIAPGARGRLAAGLALALFGAVPGAGALLILEHPLVHRGLCPLHVGEDNPGAMSAPLLALALCVGGGLVAMIGASVLRRVLLRGRWVRAGAWASLLLGAALTLAAAWSAHQRPNPSLNAYIASLPEVGALPPVGRGEAAFDEVRAPWVRMYDAGDALMKVAHVANLEVWVRIDGPLRLVGPGGVDGTFEKRWPVNLPWNDGSPITLRRDAARGLILVECELARGRGVHGTALRAAFHEPDLHGVDVSVGDLQGLSGPPSSAWRSMPRRLRAPCSRSRPCRWARRRSWRRCCVVS